MIRAFFELLMCIALIVGFMFEKEMIDFEIFLKNSLKKAIYEMLCRKGVL